MEPRPDPLDSPDPLSEGTIPQAPSVGRGVRMRIGLGAGVVLVLLAGGLAVLITAVASHPAAASTADGSSSYSGSSSGDSTPAASDDSTGGGSTSADDQGTAAGSTDASTDFVQVVGQVAKPGVYELPAGDRIIDAVAAAGGFTPTADPASLNLAQVIADGQQIVVGVKGAATTASATASGSVANGIVDINTADVTALETLSGIGPALAQRILDYRTAHGGFRSVNDLQNVTGIGPKKFAEIKASVSL